MCPSHLSLSYRQPALISCCHSIREFCDLTMPILMFDQNLDYVVLRLEDVSPTLFIAVPVLMMIYLLTTSPASPSVFRAGTPTD